MNDKILCNFPSGLEILYNPFFFIAGRKMSLCHFGDGDILVHRSSAFISDCSSPYNSVSFPWNSPSQQSLSPILFRHQLPLFEWLDYGSCH